MPTKEQFAAVGERISYLRSCTFRTVRTRHDVKFHIITGRTRRDDYHWSKLDSTAHWMILLNMVDWSGFDLKERRTVIDVVETGRDLTE